MSSPRSLARWLPVLWLALGCHRITVPDRPILAERIIRLESGMQLSRSSVRELLAPCSGHEVVTVVGDQATLAPLLAAEGLMQP